MTMPTPQQSEINKLVSILAEQEIYTPNYFRNLVLKTNLTKAQKNLRLAGLSSNPEFNARNLVGWALNQGGNTADPRYHTLGSLLGNALPDLGLEDARYVTAFILAYRLYRTPSLQQELRQNRFVPEAAATTVFDPDGLGDFADATGDTQGPDFEWEGPLEWSELQAWGQRPIEMLDVGFLQRAMKRAAGVCRVEFEHIPRLGTAFLIAPDLVLTNYHNLNFRGDEDAVSNAAGMRLRFGAVTSAAGGESEGSVFKLAPGDSIVKFSPVNALDYALLRVEETIRYQQGDTDSPLAPVQLSEVLPEKGDALHILQHPGGDSLKLAISEDGIDRVLADRGLVHYSTRARSGSSGSPAFNDEWQVVAIHHAEKSKAIGSIREGILMRSIVPEIQAFL
jgi:hypothetical protein